MGVRACNVSVSVGVRMSLVQKEQALWPTIPRCDHITHPRARSQAFITVPIMNSGFN